MAKSVAAVVGRPGIGLGTGVTDDGGHDAGHAAGTAAAAVAKVMEHESRLWSVLRGSILPPALHPAHVAALGPFVPAAVIDVLNQTTSDPLPAPLTSATAAARLRTAHGDVGSTSAADGVPESVLAPAFGTSGCNPVNAMAHLLEAAPFHRGAQWATACLPASDLAIDGGFIALCMLHGVGSQRLGSMVPTEGRNPILYHSGASLDMILTPEFNQDSVPEAPPLSVVWARALILSNLVMKLTDEWVTRRAPRRGLDQQLLSGGGVAPLDDVPGMGLTDVMEGIDASGDDDLFSTTRDSDTTANGGGDSGLDSTVGPACASEGARVGGAGDTGGGSRTDARLAQRLTEPGASHFETIERVWTFPTYTAVAVRRGDSILVAMLRPTVPHYAVVPLAVDTMAYLLLPPHRVAQAELLQNSGRRVAIGARLKDYIKRRRFKSDQYRVGLGNNSTLKHMDALVSAA